MYIVDLDNQKINVTDLDQAIEQASTFMSYQHQDADLAKSDPLRQQYWADLHQKLRDLKLKTQTP